MTDYITKGAVLLSIFILAASAFSDRSSARVVSKTSTGYYKIKGTSAAGLYRQMSQRGPHVSGARAFASTGAVQLYKGDFAIKNNRCTIKNFVVTLKFKMSLPKLASRKGLSKGTARNWRKFSGFVRRHENRHRTIWLGCARAADRQVRKIAARSCADAKRQVEAIFRRADQRCNRLHTAFDQSERSRLNAHPLIIAAKRARVRVVRKAIAIAKKRQARRTALQRSRYKTNFR